MEICWEICPWTLSVPQNSVFLDQCSRKTVPFYSENYSPLERALGGGKMIYPGKEVGTSFVGFGKNKGFMSHTFARKLQSCPEELLRVF